MGGVPLGSEGTLPSREAKFGLGQMIPKAGKKQIFGEAAAAQGRGGSLALKAGRGATSPLGLPL